MMGRPTPGSIGGLLLISARSMVRARVTRSWAGLSSVTVILLGV